MNLLPDLAARRRKSGITSVCSAHPLVLRAALRMAAESGSPALIEATCNQVNQEGGYTGLRPADFAAQVHDLARAEGCPPGLVILGGDHLGPNPWRDLPAEAAMAQAETCVAEYVAAGFRKIHLDASMGCREETAALDDATTAQRALRLARAAEEVAHGAGGPAPVYVIGTEVPPPGGADHLLQGVPATAPEAARKTYAVHAQAFAEAGLAQAFNRVIAMVVQPGVEFGNRNVVTYDPPAAAGLVQVLGDLPGLVFEAHSTDYQPQAALGALVRDGFAILKVGPQLTFALREALYALDLIAGDLVPGYGARPLMARMETAMLAEPGHWRGHYGGDEADARLLRHYSLSDRIRYLWPSTMAQHAVADLRAALDGRVIPLPLIWQHLPGADAFAASPASVDEIVIWRVGRVLRAYHAACLGGAGEETHGA
ncbi:class II D-tagatose-bisphosphate aldolase non-catalytic subunit [Paracoccus niistensis]|uniref:Class II D-tagatose-bisphosphate aldolase non-catalytic subunit n=1 Tax=Paracoccus niistensis TaxID=632935 RepID=A0ABV6I721_9RHOB